MRVERFLLSKGQEMTKHTVVLFRQASWVELRYLAIIQRPHDGRRRQSILHPLLTHALVLFPIFLLTCLAAVPGRVTLDTFVRTGPHPTSVARALEGDCVVEWHVSSGTKMQNAPRYDFGNGREGVVRCLVARGAYPSARWGSGRAQAEGTERRQKVTYVWWVAGCVMGGPSAAVAALRIAAFMVYVATYVQFRTKIVPLFFYQGFDCASSITVTTTASLPAACIFASLIDSPVGSSGRGCACGADRFVSPAGLYSYPREPVQLRERNENQ